jgi:outer membrane protein OmpA-like peptidoglycan-associated protein
VVCKSILTLAMGFVLVACSSTLQEQRRNQAQAIGAGSGAIIGGIANGGAPLGFAVGGIMGAAAGQYWYDKHIEQLQQALAAIGGQLIVLGDKVRIILPSDSLFVKNTAKLNYGAEAYLAALLNYLQQFAPICLTITGYTDAMPDRAANKSLSLRRAQTVASFLWAGGMAEQYFSVQGLGQEQAIASNQTLYGRAFNRRVEITFWQGRQHE